MIHLVVQVADAVWNNSSAIDYGMSHNCVAKFVISFELYDATYRLPFIHAECVLQAVI